ncbi:MAG: glucose-1-phosphate adenylyltransferase, partial [Firmicutes bacterium]|nr:glucose-1-phosphate adenylyltransferase [Bacillota bacterium]
ASVTDSVVMPRVKVGRGAEITRAIVAEDAVIEAGCRIGGPEGGIAVVGQGVTLSAGAVVLPGEQFDGNA